MGPVQLLLGIFEARKVQERKNREIKVRPGFTKLGQVCAGILLLRRLVSRRRSAQYMYIVHCTVGEAFVAHAIPGCVSLFKQVQGSSLSVVCNKNSESILGHRVRVSIRTHLYSLKVVLLARRKAANARQHRPSALLCTHGYCTETGCACAWTEAIGYAASWINKRPAS